NGIADAWEYLYFGHLLGAGATQDPDGDGMTNLKEYQDGNNPLQPNSGLNITAIAQNPPPMSATSTGLTWTSTTGRLYKIETTTDLTLGFSPDPGPLGAPFAPDTGTST